jgi:hypothetical protein
LLAARPRGSGAGEQHKQTGDEAKQTFHLSDGKTLPYGQCFFKPVVT